MSAALAPAAPLAPPRPTLRRPGGQSLSTLRRAAPVLPVVAMTVLIGLPKVADGRATPADAASGLVVLWAVVRTARLARRPLTRAAAVVLGLPVIGLALAATATPSPGDGIMGAVRNLQVFVLVPVAVLLLVRDRRDVRLLAWSVIGLAVWEGAVGVHQYLTGTGASYGGEFVRAVGTFGPTEVMGMATVVASGVVAATGLALGASAQRQRIVAAVCALVLLVPLTVSFSRGAWIATVAACGAQLLLAGVRRAVKVFLAAAAAGVVLVGGFGVGTQMLQERLDSITQITDAPDQSVLDRYGLWSAAVGMWSGRPVTGVGLKAFPEYRDGHAPLSLESAADTDGAGHGFYRQPFLSPHNMYLEVLSEQGLLGVVTVTGSWLALLVCGLARLHRTRTARHGRDCALIGCGLLLWQLVDFTYADTGGGSTTLVALDFGIAAWWALAHDAAQATTAPTGSPATTGPSAAPTTTAPATTGPSAAPTTTAPARPAPSPAPATTAPATTAPSKAPATTAPSAAPATTAPSGAPATIAPSKAPTTTAQAATAPSGAPATTASSEESPR